MVKKTNCRFLHNRTKKLNSEGKALVQIEVAFSRNIRRLISTGVYVSPDAWNGKEITKKEPNHLRLNMHLKRQMAQLEDHILQLNLQDRNFTPELLGAFLSNDAPETFNQYMANCLQEEIMEDNSRRAYKGSISVIGQFKPVIRFDELTVKLLREFDHWCFSKNEPLKQNTIARHHKTIKKYINKAISDGLIKMDENPYLNYKIKKAPTQHKDITWSEVLTLEKLENTGRYKVTLDCFLFSCFTGLRYEDMYVIRHLANIEKYFTFHSARHTFGSLLAELTQDPYLVMDLMGLTEIRTALVYVNNSKARVQKHLRAIEWNKLS